MMDSISSNLIRISLVGPRGQKECGGQLFSHFFKETSFKMRMPIFVTRNIRLMKSTSWFQAGALKFLFIISTPLAQKEIRMSFYLVSCRSIYWLLLIFVLFFQFFVDNGSPGVRKLQFYFLFYQEPSKSSSSLKLIFSFMYS